MNDNNRKEYTVELNYFKKGDDLAIAKDNTNNDADAFIMHAQMLEQSAETLRKPAGQAIENDLKIEDCCAHMIVVSCPENAGKVLVEDGYLFEIDLEDDVDDEEIWKEDEITQS